MLASAPGGHPPRLTPPLRSGAEAISALTRSPGGPDGPAPPPPRPAPRPPGPGAGAPHPLRAGPESIPALPPPVGGPSAPALPSHRPARPRRDLGAAGLDRVLHH